MHEDIFENIEYLIIRGQNQFKEFIQESLILIKKLIDIVNSNNLQLAGKEKIQKQKRIKFNGTNGLRTQIYLRI